MKKINMLKVSIYIFRISVVIIVVFCIVLNFVKVQQSVSVKGVFSQEGNRTTYEFNILDNSGDFLIVGSKIIMRNNLDKSLLEGEIFNREVMDLGLEEGNIAKYKVLISGNKPNYDEGKFYNLSIHTENKNKLLSIILKEVMGS